METSEISTTTPKRQRQAEYYQSHHGSSSNPKDHTFDIDDHLQESAIKRHKPCNNNSIIINLLDEDEQEKHEEEASDQHLSAIFTTLERELSSSYSHGSQRQPLNITSINSTVISDLSQIEYYYQGVETANDGSVATSADDGDDNAKSVMRHLLEASDDELGIPNCNGNENNDENSNSSNYNNNNDQSGENCINMAPFGFYDERGFWEIEDEVANYYTELHSQLFM